MLGVELIFFRRCLLPLLILGGGISIVRAQQMHAFNNLETDYHFVYRWVDPFFPLSPQVDVMTLGVAPIDKEPEQQEKIKTSTGKQRFTGRVSERVYEGSEVIASPGDSVGNITYSSINSPTRYRVAIDRRSNEQYHGKPVFIDAKGVKYIIDSKFRKQVVE
ncbi:MULTISPECIES: hypothetical protein [unclassified Sphingobacterium]|uniref:hypothetical protein n=1 Tax=unclassified Sphingobacterium TaxID=2609468 RepID=UPI00135C4F18|nr:MULTISPECIES: hypothetical protein [unclassified Sphingobacterium]MCS4167316.1 hypothetical protein [Sphingobacterium sp. BIGb0116]